MSNEKHRRDAAKIIAYVTSASNNDFAQRYKTLWNAFLEQYVDPLFYFPSRINDLFRFKNGTPEVQSSCIKHLKSYFTNHPELTADLEGEFSL